MADDGDAFREGITEYLQREAPHAKENSAVCTGWLLIAEWMDPNGDRQLSKCYAANVTHWQAKGMAVEFIHGDWPDPDDDD